MHIVIQSYNDIGTLEYERIDYFCSKCSKGVDSSRELKPYVSYELVPYGFGRSSTNAGFNTRSISGVCCDECIIEMKNKNQFNIKSYDES